MPSDNPTKFYVQPSDGMLLEYSLTKTTPVWVVLSDIRSLTYPTMSTGKVNASTLSQATRIKRKMAGWDELEDIEQTLAATAANYTAVRLLYNARGGPDIYFRFTYPSDVSGTVGIQDVVGGFVSKYSCGEAMQERDEIMEVKFTITCNDIWPNAAAPSMMQAPRPRTFEPQPEEVPA